MSKRRVTKFTIEIELGRADQAALADRIGVSSPPEPAVVLGMLTGLLRANMQAITAEYENQQRELAKRAEEVGREALERERLRKERGIQPAAE